VFEVQYSSLIVFDMISYIVRLVVALKEIFILELGAMLNYIFEISF